MTSEKRLEMSGTDWRTAIFGERIPRVKQETAVKLVWKFRGRRESLWKYKLTLRSKTRETALILWKHPWWSVQLIVVVVHGSVWQRSRLQDTVQRPPILCWVSKSLQLEPRLRYSCSHTDGCPRGQPPLVFVPWKSARLSHPWLKLTCRHMISFYIGGHDAVDYGSQEDYEEKDEDLSRALIHGI